MCNISTSQRTATTRNNHTVKVIVIFNVFQAKRSIQSTKIDLAMISCFNAVPEAARKQSRPGTKQKLETRAQQPCIFIPGSPFGCHSIPRSFDSMHACWD